MSNPASPKQLSTLTTPNSPGGEAESHTVSYARYGDTFYMVTLGGTGIDTWDVTNAIRAEARRAAQDRRHQLRRLHRGGLGRLLAGAVHLRRRDQQRHQGRRRRRPRSADDRERGAHLAIRRRQRRPARRDRQRPGRDDAERERRRRHAGHQRSRQPDPPRVLHDGYIVHRAVLPALRVPDRPRARLGRADQSEEHRHRHRHRSASLRPRARST